MTNNPFHIALFDLDGTVLDTEAQYSIFWGRMGKMYRPDIQDFDKIIKGTTLTQILGTYFPDPQLQHDIVQQLDEWEENMDYQFMHGAQKFIDDLLRNGVRCGVVTSSNQQKMSFVRRSIPQLDQMFEKILTAEMFTASKPSPDCYLQGAATFHAPISECVVFEDAFTGLEAGMRSGIFTVGLATTNPLPSIQDRCHLAVNGFSELSFQRINTELLKRQRA